MADPIVERTCQVVTDVFGLPPGEVTLATSHEAVEGWDSLNMLNILMAIEGEFGVTITPEEAAEFVSVERIVAVVRGKTVS